MKRWVLVLLKSHEIFDNDWDHRLGTKNIKDPDFPVYLVLSHFYNLACISGGMHSQSALVMTYAKSSTDRITLQHPLSISTCGSRQPVNGHDNCLPLGTSNKMSYLN